MSLLGSLFGGGPKVTPTHIATLDDFTRVVMQSPIPVIVDIWSATCAPCRQLAPVLIRVATKYRDRVRVAELDTSAEPRLLAQLRVQATPTIVVYHHGQELGRMAGFRPAEWFDDMIASEFPDA